MTFNLLDAATTAANNAGGKAAEGAGGFLGGGMGSIIMIVAMFVILYFFMIRPQQKKQKEIQKFRNSLSVGTKVITAGGIYGVIKSIDQTSNELELEIAKGIVIKIDRSCVFADSSQNQQA